MNITLIILISLAAAAFGVWLYFYLRDLNEKQRIWRSLDANAGIGKQFSNFKKKYVTPKGARVRSTVEIPAAIVAMIDIAIQNQFNLYANRFPNWVAYDAFSDYDILVIDPMATNQVNDPGSPAILVKGQQAAGMTIGVTNLDAVKKPYFVVPHQVASGWSHLPYWIDSIDNETQHGRLATNDYSRYLYYLNYPDQPPRDVHPIGLDGYPGDQ